MDTWLDSKDFDKLIQELNPHVQTGKQYDVNWENLRREKSNPFDKTVKTKTPTLLKHENHYSFTYRRYDGAHWHTELCAVDTKMTKAGLTSNQARLRDNIDTITALQGGPKLVWITPETNKTFKFDSSYQLLRYEDCWLCCINDAIYAESNRRQQRDRNYIEITFSTRNAPVFTIEQTNSILDRIIK